MVSSSTREWWTLSLTNLTLTATSLSRTRWNSKYSEVELFLNNVKKDILEPKNLRKAKDNLTREERSALGKLKFSNNVFRIQDKGSRFVIISQNEYQDKMLGQLNNDLRYNKLNHDPTIEHFEKVKFSVKLRISCVIIQQIVEALRDDPNNGCGGD